VEKKNMYNLVLARHHTNDIARVFLLPDGEPVAPMEKLLCNTAQGEDQVVTAISRSFYVPDHAMDEFLKLNGTNRANLKPITGRVEKAYFDKDKPGENKNVRPGHKVEEKKPDEDDGPCIEVRLVGVPDEDFEYDIDDIQTVDDWVEFLQQGLEATDVAINKLLKGKVGNEDEIVIPLLAKAAVGLKDCIEMCLAARAIAEDKDDSEDEES